MVITQRNSAQFGSGDSLALSYYPLSYSADSVSTLENNSAPISLNGSPVITSGNQAAGFYSRQNLYVTPGRVNSPSGYINGQFVLSGNYFVDGTPPSTNPDSTLGLFPVNGQYPLNSQYRTTVQPGAPNSGIPNQQFAVNSSDPISGQYAYNPFLAIEGNVLSSSPAFITGYEFRNGQYIASLPPNQYPIANLPPKELETSQPQSKFEGQILVNGQNIFNGKYSSSSPAETYPVSQQGTVLIAGEYDSNGVYQVGGKALTDGPNSVQGMVSVNGVISSVQVNIEGAYSSGGQYIIYNTTPPQLLQSNFQTSSTTHFQGTPSLPSISPEDALVQMAQYLVTIGNLISNTLNRSYGATTSDSVLIGQYLNLIA